MHMSIFDGLEQEAKQTELGIKMKRAEYWAGYVFQHTRHPDTAYKELEKNYSFDGDDSGVKLAMEEWANLTLKAGNVDWALVGYRLADVDVATQRPDVLTTILERAQLNESRGSADFARVVQGYLESFGMNTGAYEHVYSEISKIAKKTTEQDIRRAEFMAKKMSQYGLAPENAIDKLKSEKPGLSENVLRLAAIKYGDLLLDSGEPDFAIRAYKAAGIQYLENEHPEAATIIVNKIRSGYSGLIRDLKSAGYM